MEQLMWYTTNMVPGVENVSRELAIHTNHTGPEHWKALGFLIGYLKVKKTKGIIVRNPKVLKAVIFCDYNFPTNKGTRKSFRGLVGTLGGTLPTSSFKTQSTIIFISTEVNYVALSACAQEVKFVNMLLEEMSEVQKPEFVNKDNQGAIFLAKNRQVGMCTKHIDICHHFLRYMVE